MNDVVPNFDLNLQDLELESRSDVSSDKILIVKDAIIDYLKCKLSEHDKNFQITKQARKELFNTIENRVKTFLDNFATNLVKLLGLIDRKKITPGYIRYLFDQTKNGFYLMKFQEIGALSHEIR